MNDRKHLKFVAVVWAIAGGITYFLNGNHQLGMLELAFAAAAYLASFFAEKDA